MKSYNIKVENLVVKIFALKNFKINNHQDVSRAFNILYYNKVSNKILCHQKHYCLTLLGYYA